MATLLVEQSKAIPNISCDAIKFDDILSSRCLYCPNSLNQTTQQGTHESLDRDMIVGFGKWGFDHVKIENPFPKGEWISAFVARDDVGWSRYSYKGSCSSET
uniref:Uncharacterized protein n=1 Tax=Brassica campestris TaxID=3711 RepID=M4CS66_BRACM